jgi:hypothetical protein
MELVTKERLVAYHKLLLHIESLAERLIRLQSRYESASISNVLDGMPHSNFPGDRLSAMIEQKDNLQREIKLLTNEATSEFATLKKEIDSLSVENQKRVLLYRYCDLRFRIWRDVHTAMKISRAEAFLLHDLALDNLKNY